MEKNPLHGERALAFWVACIVIILVLFWPSPGRTHEKDVERFVVGEEYGDVLLSTCRSIADLKEIEEAARRREGEALWDRKVAAKQCLTASWKRVRFTRLVMLFRGFDDRGNTATLYLAEVEVRQGGDGAWERRFTISDVPVVQRIVNF